MHPWHDVDIGEQAPEVVVSDENPDGRFSIAENPKVPEEALHVLKDDDNPCVKMRAATTLDRMEVERNFFKSNEDPNNTRMHTQ